MAVRRTAFERWAGFDPRLGSGAPLPGGEESLAFLQLVQGGGRVVYTPGSVVRHPYPDGDAAVVARTLRDDPVAVAYTLYLIARERGIRWQLLCYAVGGALGVRRGWRATMPVVAPPVASWRRWRARLAGIPLFLRVLASPDEGAR